MQRRAPQPARRGRHGRPDRLANTRRNPGLNDKTTGQGKYASGRPPAPPTSERPVAVDTPHSAPVAAGRGDSPARTGGGSREEIKSRAVIAARVGENTGDS